MTGSTRIPCCIEGCRRSFRRDRFTDDADGSEIMCGKHWRMIDRRLRERHKQMKRRFRRIERLMRLIAVQRLWTVVDVERLQVMFIKHAERSWQACKADAAIKAALHAEDAPKRMVAA